MRGTALVVAVLVVPLAGCSGASTSASCVGPQLALSTDEGHAGDGLTVSVEWLHEGCDDTVPDEDDETSATATVVLVSGGTETELGSLTGQGDRWSDYVDVAVPADAPAGSGSVGLRWTDAGEVTDAVRFTVLP